jgi:hypothetical protein
LASVPLFLSSGWFSHLSTREKYLASAVLQSTPRNGTHICRPVKNSWQPPCFVW